MADLVTNNEKLNACLLQLCGQEVTLDAHNKGGGNFKYASLPHLQRVVMPVVREHGLMLTQTTVNWDVEFRLVKVQKTATAPPTDKLMCLAKCEVKTALTDLRTGACVYVTTYGSKVDQSSGDKSLGALTTAKRYGIAALFNLILSDDDGGDTDAAPSPFDLIDKPAITSPVPVKPNPLSSILGI
jgi:hypothetical protein